MGSWKTLLFSVFQDLGDLGLTLRRMSIPDHPSLTVEDKRMWNPRYSVCLFQRGHSLLGIYGNVVLCTYRRFCDKVFDCLAIFFWDRENVKLAPILFRKRSHVRRLLTARATPCCKALYHKWSSNLKVWYLIHVFKTTVWRNHLRSGKILFTSRF